MCYLAQPCDEFSDPSHTAKIRVPLRSQTKGCRPFLKLVYAEQACG